MRKFLLLLLTISAVTASAQNFSNKGRDFWVGYGYHQIMTNGNGQEMVLYFATDQVTTVTVTIPGLGWTRTYNNIPANSVFTSDPMPKGTSGNPDARLQTSSAAPESKGIHIIADKPIVAYSHIYNMNVSGASILFPTSTLGKEYYSINYKNISNTTDANCWFYVVASDTGTTSVEITPSANAIGHAANVPFTINLTQGQVYNVMGEFTNQNNAPHSGVDLTGSKIRSIPSATGACKRIGVFSGSGRISITCSNASASSDNYMVQAFPKDAWGKKYLTAPTSSLNSNVYRICVTDPTTIVRVNNAPIAVPIDAATNFYYDLPQTTAPQKIEADKPIMVVQYIASQSNCGNPPTATNPGDPEVLYLSPVEQNISKVLWNATPNFNITQHYFNAVIPNTGTAISSFRLDGAAVNPALFTVHPQDPGFSYLSRPTTAGPHTIESDSGFNAIAYGFGNAESYGYNAGTNIRDLYNFIGSINPFSLVTDAVACTGTPFYYTVTFPFQPTSLFWNFNNNPFQTPNTNVTVTAPVADSTYFIGIKQVWRYKLPTLYSITPANSTPGYLVTITAGTTSSEGCGNSFERDFYMAVYDPPIAKMEWINNGCVTDSVRFRDTTVYLAGTYSYKWFWDFGDGTIDSVRNPVHLYANPGTYNVKFSMISNVGCFSDTAVRQVTVTNIPVANFTTSTPICLGSSIAFTSTSVAPPLFGSLQKWYWDFGDGNIQTVVAPATPNVPHIYNAWGNVRPKLRVETNSGCQSLLDSLPIYVGPIPLANFNLPGGLCLPSDSAQFTNASTIANGNVAGLTYQWTFGDPPSGANNNSTITNPIHYYNNAGPFTISLQVTSADGCVHDTSKVLSTVYPQPVSAFAVAPENCLNTATTFTSNSSGSGNAITNWFWDFGDATTGSGQNTTHTYLVPGTYVVKHWVRTVTNCYSDTIPQTVVINPLPTVNFNYNTPSCEDRTVSFTDVSVANAGTLNQWGWNFGDPASGVLNTSALTNPQHIFTNPGTYAVTLVIVTTKGCSDTVPINVIVNSQPSAGYINPEVCLSDTYAQFNDTSSVTGDVITQWFWNFDDPISGALNTSTVQNPQHSYSTIGTKNVRLIVTSSNGCKDTTIQSFFVNGDIPVAGLSVYNANALCANDSVSIENTSTVNVGSVVKVEIYWDNIGAPGVFEIDDLPFPGKVYSHLYPNFQSPPTVNYQIRFRAYSGATCVDDFIQNIIINAAPKVLFNAIPDTCLNIAPFQLTQASEIGGVPGTFVFTGPGVSSTGIFDPALVGPGLYTIKYTFTSNSGCMDSAQRQIRILAAPTANFGFSLPGCETKAITFRDSCTAPVGTITTWTWDFDDGTPLVIRNTNTVFTHVFANAGTYDVKLLVTTDDGCNSLIKVKQIIVYPLPLASFNFTDTACLPNAVIQFNNTSSIADGTESSFSYLWNFGDPATGAALNTSSLIAPSHIYNGEGPYTVRLMVTSINGCIDDSIQSVNTIHPQPEADFSFNKPSACIGDDVKLIDMSDPKDGSFYQWYWNFGDDGNAITQNPSHTYAAIGSYTVRLAMTNSFGCKSDTMAKQFTVYPFPVITAGADQQVLEGESTILQAAATGDDMAYLWLDITYLNNNSIIRPTCTPVNDITYTLTVTGRGGCAVIDQVKIFVLKTPQIPNTFSPNRDGINDVWEIKYLKTYPNARVQVFTRAGQKVFESKGYRIPWNGTMEGKALPVDTYYYIIEPESGREPVTGYVTIVK